MNLYIEFKVMCNWIATLHYAYQHQWHEQIIQKTKSMKKNMANLELKGEIESCTKLKNWSDAKHSCPLFYFMYNILCLCVHLILTVMISRYILDCRQRSIQRQQNINNKWYSAAVVILHNIVLCRQSSM